MFQTFTSVYSKIKEAPTHTPIFALVDCNNFFVSCERIFRPDLEGKPVVVLSSNDGCVVARSNEAKQLGIPMAAPAFKYRDLFKRHNVIQFSANFDLYGDISRRITQVLATITPHIEIYSVDESFFDISQLAIADYTAWGTMVRSAILQWVGVPVSIGIAPSKTLAKLASERAKKVPQLSGVLSFMGMPKTAQTRHLQAVPVQDVWGIGRRLAPKIQAQTVMNAADLSRFSPHHAQHIMGIHGRQLVAELNGVSCYPMEYESKNPKSIARTRTFGEDTTDLGCLEAAIATFATQAAFRLRTSGQVARCASLFLTTNKHKPGYQSWHRHVTYHTPTADTGQIITTLLDALGNIYQPSQTYHRAGVLLSDFWPAQFLQTDLLGLVHVDQQSKATRRMATLDVINEKFGKHTLRYAAQDLGTSWQPQHNLRSPRYTTHLAELPILKILKP